MPNADNEVPQSRSAWAAGLRIALRIWFLAVLAMGNGMHLTHSYFVPAATKYFSDYSDNGYIRHAVKMIQPDSHDPRTLLLVASSPGHAKRARMISVT
jgi:hypothetical protein